MSRKWLIYNYMQVPSMILQGLGPGGLRAPSVEAFESVGGHC